MTTDYEVTTFLGRGETTWYRLQRMQLYQEISNRSRSLNMLTRELEFEEGHASLHFASIWNEELSQDSSGRCRDLDGGLGGTKGENGNSGLEQQSDLLYFN